jgi:hypothetical protein
MSNKTKHKQAAAGPISTQIIVQPVVRTVHDVAAWRSALRMADNGNRTKLYDLYSDILLDGVLADAIDKRIDAVKDADLSFTIDNKDVDVMYDLMDTVEFEELIGEIMMAKFWGISVDEFDFDEEHTFRFTSINRKHIRPKLKEIVRQQTDDRGISYAGDDRVIQWGKDDDLGLLLKVSPLVIYKRGGFGDWAQFVELFGMPLRIGKYSAMDEASRRELIRAFETAGSAPYLVIPKETEATQEANAASGNGLLYKEFRQACTEEILITILGQTMTTVDGSSLAQGQVHMAVQEKKHRADRRFVERMLNRYFVPMLIRRGYPITGGKFRYMDAKRELEVPEIIQLSDILPIPQSYLHEKYNIPLPEPGEPIARRQAQPLFGVPDGSQEDDETDEEAAPDEGKADAPEPDKKAAEEDAPTSRKVKHADRDRGNFFTRLFDFFVPARSYGRATSDILTLSEATLADALIRQTIETKGRAYFSADLFAYTHTELIRGLRKGYRRADVRLADSGFVYNANDDAYITALEQNLFHFSAAKTLAEVSELNRLFRESKGYSDFRKKARALLKVYNEQWLRTEYNTAVSVAESASTYRRLVVQANIFPFWEYRTVGDNRVRLEHQALEGLTLPTDDPRWQKIMPPNGWNCRCYITPRMRHEGVNVDFGAMQKRCDDYLESPEWKQCEAQGFGINRANEAEVFTANQMYIHKFPNMSSKTLEKITPQEWGVRESVDTLKREAENEVPKYEGSADEWFEANKVVEDGTELLKVEDYIGRVWQMAKAAFVTHSTNAVKKRGFRTEFLNAIREVAASPDEVWLARERKDRINKVKTLNNYVMVKFYKDIALAVVGKLEKSKLTLKSWYVLRDKAPRRGLLIRKRPKTK